MVFLKVICLFLSVQPLFDRIDHHLMTRYLDRLIFLEEELGFLYAVSLLTLFSSMDRLIESMPIR